MNFHKCYPNVFFAVTALLLCVSSSFAQNAQKEYTVEQVSVMNLGDGRWLYRDLVSEQPLNGNFRIVDGYHSVYIQADFKDGLYNGDYEECENNRLVTDGKYKEGLKNGVFHVYNASGDKVLKETSYLGGKLDGWQKSYFTTGQVEREQQFKNGKEDGVERQYSLDGDLRRECHYRNGVYDGEQMIIYQSNLGELVEKFSYKNGVQEGAFSQLFDTGTPHVTGEYKAGKKSGRWTTFRDSGDTIRVETFNAGKLEGLQITYNSETGKRLHEAAMKNDRRNGLCKEYDPDNGELISEAQYVNDKRHGAVKVLVTDNRSDYWETYHYVNDYPSGAFESHYIKNNRLREKGNYLNGHKVGRWERYDLNGKLEREWDE